MHVYALIIAVVVAFAAAWIIGLVLVVTPLRVENHALLKLLDEHLLLDRKTENRFERSIKLLLDEGASFTDLLDTEQGVTVAGVEVAGMAQPPLRLVPGWDEESEKPFTLEMLGVVEDYKTEPTEPGVRLVTPVDVIAELHEDEPVRIVDLVKDQDQSISIGNEDRQP